jgi:hypothetical protein
LQGNYWTEQLMNRNETLLADVQADLQIAPRVLYVEGESDIGMLWALLGLEAPLGNTQDQVLVKAVNGKNSIRQRIKIAQSKRLSNVFGVVDLDGDSYDANQQSPPTWSAYCLENLLVQTGWPAALGEAPDMQAIYKELAPYSAVSTLSRTNDRVFKDAGLLGYTEPAASQQRLSANDLANKFAKVDIHQLQREFHQIHAGYLADIEANNADSIHTWLNGKWIVEVISHELSGQSKDTCRDIWLDHARAQGGSDFVKNWWHTQFAAPRRA